MSNIESGGSMSATASVYPVFDIGSISEWCNKDVDSFITQETNKRNEENIKLKEKGEMPLPDLNLDTGFRLTTEGLENKVACETAIAPFIDFINKNLPKDEKGENKTYVNAISEITDAELQNKLWIARTFLFSQLMIFEVVILGKTEMYTEVFGEANGKTIFSFMPEVTSDLPNYQMGIFGSKTPTSDIDVGIQYIGKSTTPTLHYILSVFENLFLTFTGKSSLDFDMEPYGDLYLIQDDNGNDYFYLDSGNFEVDDFEKILPVAGLSIARNVLMDDPNAEPTPTFDDIISDVNAASKSTPFADSIGTELMSVLNNSGWLSESMTDMKEFLNSNYDAKRTKYYEALLAAETKKFKVAPTFTDAEKLTSKKNNGIRCELINLVGRALAYRMESYAAAPTITHVVRILQADKDAVEKYKTKTPEELCNDKNKVKNSAYCAIGKYGFVISILEQMGYMSRFYKHYCVGDHIDQAKCNKKMKKYGDRYVDGFEKYKKHIEILNLAKATTSNALGVATTSNAPGVVTNGGGKRRTRRRNKNRKTLKRGKYRKGSRTRK